MGVHRSELRRRRRTDAAETKLRNRPVKTKERARRDARMVEKLRTGSLPYAPTVMSWLSRKLDRGASKITHQDVQTLIS